MINLAVDEAYAFDFLSILEVKKLLNNDDKTYYDCLELIREQVGESKFQDVILSPQYKDLVNTNKRIFDYIEEIRKGKKLDAKVVDDANMARFMYKKELQAKFFSTKLTEKKTTTSF